MGLVRIGNIEEVPRGEGRRFRLGDREIAVFRTWAGEIFAAQPDCPHAGGPLADGLLGGASVTCPLHDRSFDLRSGRNLSGDCEDICVFPVAIERDGGMVVELAE
ncbi:Rieske 2Fe-2S domain-containing protein [Methylocystis heyeri]|uniref:Rieske 2Fe-2S domain-containing protein n=1 Tax=Methylocystis heyeri TaxID=391905 RepID=A0A6B8KAY7_9HYPH|nr:Rieske 2Fe-2S domain-containing protein [Methylocystis heyeri]QGM44672.1 Rieske 2Fe-2S domain-containing protein [Methylocystis heyeri]